MYAVCPDLPALVAELDGHMVRAGRGRGRAEVAVAEALPLVPVGVAAV